MAGKLSAIGSNCYVGAFDLSGDIGAVTNLEAMLATIAVTGIDKAAPELIEGRRDGAMAFAAFYNIDAGQEHAVFSAAPRTDVISTVAIGTPGLGTPAASMIAKQMNYAGTLGDDGSLGFAINMVGSGFGLNMGELLTTGKQTFATGTVNGTALDLGAVSTAFGAAAYLHVFSHGSGTATFTIADSDDNSSFSPVTGLAFTAVTGATTERIQTAALATVRQYVRIQKTGTSTATVAAIVFVRHTQAGLI